MTEPELFPQRIESLDNHDKSVPSVATSLTSSSRSSSSANSGMICDSNPEKGYSSSRSSNHGDESCKDGNNTEYSELDVDHDVTGSNIASNFEQRNEYSSRVNDTLSTDKKAKTSSSENDFEPIKLIFNADDPSKRQVAKVTKYNDEFSSDDENYDEDDEDGNLLTFQTSLRSLSVRTKQEWETTSLLFPHLSLWMDDKEKLQKEIEINHKDHPLLGLPSDVLEHVLSYLDHTDCRMVQQVNKAMHDLLTKVSHLNKKLWTQACCHRWSWLSSFFQENTVANDQEPNTQFVDSLHLPTPLEFVTLDSSSIINYGLLLALSVACKLQAGASHNSEIELANKLSLLRCSSGNTMMRLDEKRFLYTATRHRSSPRFRFIKNNDPEEFSEHFAETFSNDEGSPYCTTVQYIGHVGIGVRSIRTIQPFYNPDLITQMPVRSVVVPEKKDLGFFKKVQSFVKRLLGCSDLEEKEKDSTIVKCSFHDENGEIQLSYFWKPFVIPFVSSYCELTKIRHVELMPRLVNYFEITILSPASATITRTASERPMETVRDVTESVAIGIADRAFSSSGGFPGCDWESYGYHGNDGHVYHGVDSRRRRRRPGEGQDMAYGPRFGVNDTIGCGLDYYERAIFFTLNGTFLGYAFENLSVDLLASTMFFPVIGVDSNYPIYCNFGYQDPFTFDLTSYILTHQQDVLLKTLVTNYKSSVSKKKRKSRKVRKSKRTS